MAYLAPIHRSSSVRHAIKLSFTAPDSDDLIVAKANRLEIWATNTQADGPTLILQHTKALYGKVTLLQKLRPATSQTDHLFVGTDRYNYFTLSWDAERTELRTEKSRVDIAEKAARDSQTGDRVHIDPTSRFLTLEVYEGVVNVLPIAHAGKGKRKAADDEVGELGDPVAVRIPELFVRSSCFLHRREVGGRGLKEPLFAVLHEDSQNNVRIKVRELEYSPSLRPNEEPATVELEKGKDVQGALELGAAFLIPLAAPTYGMMVIGETSISYVDEFEYQVSDTQPLDEATVFCAWCQLDEQRYVLADEYGRLYLLMVEQRPNGEYDSHRIDVLGQTSRANTLVYLDGGRVFVGSHQGDSQIIQIHEKRIEILQTFPNIAPILDFTVMDMGNRSSDALVNEFSSGQARIVTGSGAFQDGSLRSVRSGVGLEDKGSLGDLGAPISAIFSLRSSAGVETVDTLVVSHVSHTSVIVFSQDGEIEARDEYRGFDLSETTLFAGNLSDGRALQVTSSSVLLTDAEVDMVTDRWQAPSGSSITAVAADEDKALVSLQGAALVVLDLSASNIRVQAERQFGSEEQVSCIAISPAVPNACVAGFWKDSRVSFLSLGDLQPIATEQVAEEDILAVPRSLVLAHTLRDQPATLFVGLADGNVVTYSITSPQQPFTARKSIILGTQQANFALLPRGDGLQNVFATCEHPSLIYGSEGRVVYSAVTAENAICVASFDSFGDYAGAIAIATTSDDGENELKIAVVDEERTTHVQDLFMHETVRRIAYSGHEKAFGLGCIKRTLRAGEEEVVSHFKLVDEIAFKELDSLALNEDELIESVIRCKFHDGSGDEAERFVVGTSYLDHQDAQNARGRIIVLEITEDRRIKMVTELEIKGSCRCLAVCKGRIVAALTKTVVVYAFEYTTPSSPTLTKKAMYRTATAPIDIAVTDNIIAITDLMKSMSLVEYKPGRAGMADSLREVARHYETLWGTAVANVDANTYLVSDAEGNLVVLQHDVDGFSDEDRRRLRVTSEFLLGEMVNRIRPIAVQPTPAATVVPKAFIATVDGSLYVFCLIAQDKQDLLMRLQGHLAEVVKAPGEVKFEKFRGFKTAVRDMGEEGPVRFVDGELIERFLDLPEEVAEGVARDLGEVESVREMVEGLRRIH